MTLSELADRVEAATGPDSGLDAEIGRFAIAGFLGHVPDEPQWGCAKFTESLDAAMTLVPEGHTWALEGPNQKQVCAAWCYDKECHNTLPSLAATPALALCAAALRARAQP